MFHLRPEMAIEILAVGTCIRVPPARAARVARRTVVLRLQEEKFLALTSAPVLRSYLQQYVLLTLAADVPSVPSSG